MSAKQTRIDKLLVDRGLAGSRERARRLLMSGAVWVAQRRIDKPGALVPVEAPVEVRGADIPFVSRGGLKLDAALTYWSVPVNDLVAVDVGASTGGFTDCLLQRGVRRVYAIDVGYGQFAWNLRRDPRVQLFERTNIRQFEPDRLGELVDVAVIDVSFISLRLVLPAVLRLLVAGGILLPLVKPQFEVGRGEVGKGGVVRDPARQHAAVGAVRHAAEELGLRCLGELASPILGPRGNQEFFLYLKSN